MQFLQEFPLQNLNTFGLDVKSKFYKEFSSMEELLQIINDPIYKENKVLILGGGSNLLFTKDFDGLVLKNNIKGIIRKDAGSNQVIVTSGAGEVWHDLVLDCVNQGLGGLENLSLIPGTVGASPMQNIGAYGVEIKDVFEQLEAVDRYTGEIFRFTSNECRFGYRTSVFKTTLKDKFIITSVSFRLNRIPTFNTSYGAINQTLEEMGVKELSIKAISEAVCQIRESKLPNPAKIGNAGSFFKNPEISLEKFERIKSGYPDIVNYPTAPGMTKIPAGWLIEKCGWKGKTLGNAGVHTNQALVLVNLGKAKGADILQLAENVKASVRDVFGIDLEIEVNVIN
ncbi:MAG: UDP-N-acetylmuramate dehydrogenase [Cytophagaceae bacterium]